MVEARARAVVVRGGDDLRRLHVESALTGSALEAALAGIGVVDGDDVLLDLAALRELAAGSGDDWSQRWTAMVDGASRAGWTTAGGSVRAHVVHPG